MTCLLRRRKSGIQKIIQNIPFLKNNIPYRFNNIPIRFLSKQVMDSLHTFSTRNDFSQF